MQEDAADRLDAVFPGDMMVYVGLNEAFGSNARAAREKLLTG